MRLLPLRQGCMWTAAKDFPPLTLVLSMRAPVNVATSFSSKVADLPGLDTNWRAYGFDR